MKEDEEEIELKKNDKYVKYVLIFAILWLVVAPIILTQFSIVDFTGTGQIGDTISGISMPIISLVSAFLIYLSFKAQIQANRKMNKQIIKAHEETNFIFLNNEIDRFKKNILEIEKDPLFDSITNHQSLIVYCSNIGSILSATKDYDILYLLKSREIHILLGEINLFSAEIDKLTLSIEHNRAIKLKFYYFHMSIFHMTGEIIKNWNFSNTSHITDTTFLAVCKKIKEKMENLKNSAEYFGSTILV